MQSNRAELRLFNLPKQISQEQKQENEYFISKLERLLQNYQFISDGGIDSICIGLIYNADVNLADPIIHNQKLYFSTSNLPRLISGKQDIKDRDFRSRLGPLLKSYSFFPKGGIDRISVILFYNKRASEIKIKGLNDDKNDEGLVNFLPVDPKFSIEQVILNNDLLQEIRRTLIILNQKRVIYEEWGFNQIDPEPRAIINFYGPSGTGKTMTAHAIASELGCKILVLNYADIESKFVGDAPKNLVRAFEIASKEVALLFFDEADSFLGKRITNVSSSSDQAVNSLRSQMLILLENFEGVVVFATNLIRNYDRAFESRIFKHLKFHLPSAENRKKIIQKTIPQKVPFEKDITDNEIDILVELSEEFSGREIKNAILEALTHAITEERKFVNFKDFENERFKASRHELQQEYGQTGIVNPEQKKAIEEKIRANLSCAKNPDSVNDQQDSNTSTKTIGLTTSNTSFYKSLMDVGCHAALVDSGLQTEEKEILERTAKVFNLNYVIPQSITELPPINSIISLIDTKQKKVEVIDFAFHIIIATGICTIEEENFMEQLCKGLSIEDDNLIAKVIALMLNFADKEGEWKNTKAKILL